MRFFPNLNIEKVSSITSVCFTAVAVSLLATSIPSQGADLTVRQAVQEALSINPDIKSLDSQWESARAKTRLSLAPTEPTVSVTYNDLDKAFDVPNSGSTVFAVTQPLAFPGKAWVNHSSLDHQAESIFYQLKAKELDVANTVKNAYYQVALAQKNIELNAETKASYTAILAAAKRRYEAGAITQVDLLSAEMALYYNDNDLTDLLTAQRTAIAQLNFFLGRSADAPVTVEPLPIDFQLPPLMSLTQAQERMGANRPEIKSAVETVVAADKTYTSAKMSLLPDFQFTLGTTQYNLLSANPINAALFPNGSPNGNPNYPSQTWMVGVQATVPLWGFFNEREAIVGASHDRAAAEANLSALQLQSNIALESALESLKALQTKISNYEEHLLKLSDQSLKIALVSYGTGKIDYQTLSEAATARRQVRHDYYGLIENYLTSYSAFGQLIGEDL